MYIPNEVEKWADKQFIVMKGKNNQSLSIDDMEAVREIAFTKFGYIMNVAEAVAIAFKKELKVPDEDYETIEDVTEPLGNR